MIAVFIGPTISAATAGEYLDAQYLPPAAQGDVFKAAQDAPLAIGIVDGYFHRVPSVWHKEILWALSQGIHVFGSASMGALRAAELDSFGMVGVGRIYEDYRDGIISNDDEVAVTHGPAETGYLALSEALANIRPTLLKAQQQQVISSTTGAALLKLAEATFFPERSYDNLIAGARQENLPGREIDTLSDWLKAGRIDQKKHDAIDMLKHMAEFAATNPEKKQVRYHVETTYLFDDHVQ
ncbi:MAG: TfuA-like protein [Pseudomonadota bacterium]